MTGASSRNTMRWKHASSIARSLNIHNQRRTSGTVSCRPLAGSPVVREHRRANRSSRIQRWQDTVAALALPDLQVEYAAGLEALPNNRQEGP